MSRRALLKSFLLVAAILVLAQAGSLVGGANPSNDAIAASISASITPTVKLPAAFGQSLPVRDLPSSTPPPGGGIPKPGLEEDETRVHPFGDGSYKGPDPALQQASAGSGIPPTSQNFEGVDIGESSSDGVFIGAPPDTNGDVGPNHYVQIVNTVFSIYSKTGQRLAGPTPIDNLWKSAPNPTQFNYTA